MQPVFNSPWPGPYPAHEGDKGDPPNIIVCVTHAVCTRKGQGHRLTNTKWLGHVWVEEGWEATSVCVLGGGGGFCFNFSPSSWTVLISSSFSSLKSWSICFIFWSSFFSNDCTIRMLICLISSNGLCSICCFMEGAILHNIKTWIKTFQSMKLLSFPFHSSMCVMAEISSGSSFFDTKGNIMTSTYFSVTM